jgi:hypothetical protein
MRLIRATSTDQEKESGEHDVNCEGTSHEVPSSPSSHLFYEGEGWCWWRTHVAVVLQAVARRKPRSELRVVLPAVARHGRYKNGKGYDGSAAFVALCTERCVVTHCCILHVAATMSWLGASFFSSHCRPAVACGQNTVDSQVPSPLPYTIFFSLTYILSV